MLALCPAPHRFGRLILKFFKTLFQTAEAAAFGVTCSATVGACGWDIPSVPASIASHDRNASTPGPPIAVGGDR